MIWPPVIERAPANHTDAQLLLSIGGVVGHLCLRGGTGSEAFVQQARERYAPYALPAAPWVERSFSLILDVTAGSPPAEPGRRAWAVSARPLQVLETAERIRIERWDLAAELRASRVARASLPAEDPRAPAPADWDGEATCEMNPFALDSLLRVLWSIFLPLQGGALVHACAFRTGAQAVLFPGPSGAGKSSLARKVPDPDRILSDEMVAVTSAAGGGWRVGGTPFWGEFQRGGGSIRSWPLRAVAFLEQRPRLAVSPLSAAEAAQRLLACFISFDAAPAVVARNVAIALRLVQEVSAVSAATALDTPVAELEAALDARLPSSDLLRDRQPASEAPSAREAISDLRWFLRQHGRHAFRALGGSMQPALEAGDSLFLHAVAPDALRVGDVVAYWTPGASPARDRLTCHRIVARVPTRQGGGYDLYIKGDAHSGIERIAPGERSEILAKVVAVSRDGHTWPMPGRLGGLARAAASLISTPLLRAAGR